MCMTGDGCAPEFYDRRDVKAARKQHRCDECGRTIEIGEPYERVAAIWPEMSPEVSTWSTCPHCVAARHWLDEICSGWLHGAVLEDIGEHVDELACMATSFLYDEDGAEGKPKPPGPYPSDIPEAMPLHRLVSVSSTRWGTVDVDTVRDLTADAIEAWRHVEAIAESLCKQEAMPAA